MSDPKGVTRRSLLKGSASLSAASLINISGASLIALTQTACSAREEAAAFKVLSEHEAADFAAIASRILPTTDTPGANEAGVIYFFDAALAEEMSSSLEFARSGLAEFNQQLGEAFPGSGRFDALSEDEQDAFLRSQENSPLFQLAWVMTMFGMFAMSKYGGNKDSVGWSLVDFKGAHGGWQYPFGHYDAEVHGGNYDV